MAARSGRYLSALRTAVLAATSILLAGASCPTDPGSTYLVVVRGVGAGTGTVSSAHGMACQVRAAGEQGTCTEVHAHDLEGTEQRNFPVFQAVPTNGSTFAGWITPSDPDLGSCRDPAQTTCEVVVPLRSADSVVIRPHFAGPGGDVELRVAFRADPYQILWVVDSDDGEIHCDLHATAVTACSAWFGVGTTVHLQLHEMSSPSFGRWDGCIPVAGAPMECTVLMDSNRVVTAHWNIVPGWHLVVEGAGTGSGIVTSARGEVACTITVSVTSGHCLGDVFTAPFIITATPAAGSVFTGWSGSGCLGTAPCTVTPNAIAMSVTATFDRIAPKSFALSIAGAGAGSGVVTSNPIGLACTSTAGVTTGACSLTADSGATVTLSAAPSAGSTFAGWTGGGCIGTGTCVVTLAAATTVTAMFEASFPVTIAGLGAGSGTVTSSPAGILCTLTAGVPSGTCSSSFPSGSEITLTATPAAGSVAQEILSDACRSVGTCTFTLNAATTVTVVFGLPMHQLTVLGGGTHNGHVASDPGSMSCGIMGSTILFPMDCTRAFAPGTVVTLTATASSGFPGALFTGWSGGGCSGTGTCVVTMNAATTVTASFGPATAILTIQGGGTHNGHVASDPGSMSCGVMGSTILFPMDCTRAFAVGTVVTLTATASPGFPGALFTGWSGGGCSGTGSTCVVTMNAATTVTVSFGPATHILTVNGGGTHFGHVVSDPGSMSCGIMGSTVLVPSDCTRAFAPGTVVTLTATAAPNAVLTGWSGGGCSGTGSTCAVTMNAATTVTVSFGPATMFALSVSFSGSGTGTITSSPAGINCANFSGGGSISCNADYAGGTVVTLTAAPNAGGTFAGWSGGGCSGTAPCAITMNAAQNVVASFAVATFPLTVTGAGTGNGTVQEMSSGLACQITAGVTSGTCVANVPANFVIFPVATPAQGSIFAGWSGDCSGTGFCAVPMDQARSVTATFTAVPTFTLTIERGATGTGAGAVISNPDGITCGFTGGVPTPTGTCAFAFPAGTVVTLTAAIPPLGGSSFGSWSGAPACTASPVCQVTMDQNRTVGVNINP